MSPENTYLVEIYNHIQKVLNKFLLNNFLAQIRAKSIGASFKSTYDEEMVWEDAQYLAINGATIVANLGREHNNLGYVAIKRSAEIFEYLSKVSEKYDKEYLTILSALCYDISGFQANAYSMVSSLNQYELGKVEGAEINYFPVSSTVTGETNLVIGQVLLILQKRLPYAQFLLKEIQPEKKYLKYVINFLNEFYNSALKGGDEALEISGSKAYYESFSSGNYVVNMILHLLNVRVSEFRERSIWNFVKLAPTEHNYLWRRYAKLIANSYYDGTRLKSLKNRVSRFELWNSQLEALKKGVISDESSYVIQMPTSAGKTMIAEMAILNTWAKDFDPSAKILYIAPYRALVNQVENELRTNLSKLKISVSSLVGSFEYDIFDELLIEESNILVTTPEKADMLLRTNVGFFKQLKLVISDEGHVIGEDGGRSYLFELLLSKIRLIHPQLKILFMSAVLAKNNAAQLARWLTKEDSSLLISPPDCEGEEWKPTRKIIGKFKWGKAGGRIVYENIVVTNINSKKTTKAFVHNIIEQSILRYKHPVTRRFRTLKFPSSKGNKSETAALLAYKLSTKGPTLVFCSRPDWALGVAKSFIKLFSHLSIKGDAFPNIFCNGRSTESYSLACEWYGDDHEISKCLALGIGIHFGKMIKALRQTIEKEYKNGSLQILISTNTIGQGLNFPIKNLIFHSVEINPQLKDYRAISVRDFWNILGRAGRAGKETEGHIVFLTLTDKDEQLFKKYINIENLEDVESYFYKQVKELYDERISNESFLNNIGTAAESTILQLLCEEGLDTSIYELHESLSGNTLFNVQIREDVKLESFQDNVSNAIRSRVNKVQTQITDQSKMKLFSKTGFNISFCEFVFSLVEENMEVLKEALRNEDEQAVFSFLWHSLYNVDYSDVGHDDMNFMKSIDQGKINYVFKSWSNGQDIQLLKEFWITEIQEDIKKLNFIISVGFEYLFPWISSAILEFIYFILEVEEKDVAEDIKAIPTFIKYGANNKFSCFLLSLGVRSRKLAVYIPEKVQFQNLKNVIKWLSGITHNELEILELDKLSIAEIYNISEKIGSRTFNTFLSDEINIKTYISGIKFEDSRIRCSIEIKKGESLELVRDHENLYDPYAIYLKKSGTVLGYVPREEARFLSPYIDIDEETFYGVVESIDPTENTWNNIKIVISKSPF